MFNFLSFFDAAKINNPSRNFNEKPFHKACKTLVMQEITIHAHLVIILVPNIRPISMIRFHDHIQLEQINQVGDLW